MRSQSGFTLVELMIVATVVSTRPCGPARTAEVESWPISMLRRAASIDDCSSEPKARRAAAVSTAPLTWPYVGELFLSRTRLCS